MTTQRAALNQLFLYCLFVKSKLRSIAHLFIRKVGQLKSTPLVKVTFTISKGTKFHDQIIIKPIKVVLNKEMLNEQKPCQPVVLHDRVVVVGSVQVQSVDLVEGVRQT